MDNDIVIDWIPLIEKMECYTTMHGNEIYPFQNKKQWVEYNRLCIEQKLYEQEDERYKKNFQLSDDDIQELLNRWDIFKKQTKKDKTILAIYEEKESGYYKIIPCYKEGIKKIS